MENIFNKINNTIEYIEEKLFDEVSDEKICQILGLNKIVAASIFEILTGYTIKEYIRDRRLSEAVFFLKNDRVVDVAMFCGYDSREGFSRAFKAFHGVSPSDKLGNFKYLERIVLTAPEYNLQPKNPHFLSLPNINLYGYISSINSQNLIAESTFIKRRLEKKYSFNAEYGVFISQNGKSKFFVGRREPFPFETESRELKGGNFVAYSSPISFEDIKQPVAVNYITNEFLYKREFPIGLSVLSLF